MDWTQYVRTLCRKPGAAEHTRFFSAMPLPWQSCAAMCRSVNGGGVDTPDGWDDVYEMFFAALDYGHR